MNTKTIPLASVRDALMLAKVRQVTQRHGPPTSSIARFAAFTDNPRLLDACRQVLRRYKPIHLAETHFGLMYRGELLDVLQRTRNERGLQEVRRTWRACMRDLKAEFADWKVH